MADPAPAPQAGSYAALLTAAVKALEDDDARLIYYDNDAAEAMLRAVLPTLRTWIVNTVDPASTGIEVKRAVLALLTVPDTDDKGGSGVPDE